MQLEVGTILEGKVTGITKFGAFVELPGGKTGMVHISEVAPTYVKEIRDFVAEDQVVKVKVLSVGEDGKVSLSIKKAMDPQTVATASAQADRAPSPMGMRRGGSSRRPFVPRPQAERPGNFEWQSSVRTPDGGSFEDMMSKFKQSSDEKMTDIKRAMDSKRGSVIKRGGGGR